VDASKGFRKDGPKNRLREQDIHRIVDTFTKHSDIPGYARMVPVTEISDAKNDYNLNLPRYIDSTEVEDLQDIEGHLRGGIPTRDLDALDSFWQVIPSVRAALFDDLRPGYSQLRISKSEIKPSIFGHPEFTAFNAKATALFDQWKSANTPHLTELDKDGHPKALIETIAESLLQTFEHAPLVDAYAVFQHLMDYWEESMKDDCYLIASDGWVDAAKPKLIIEDKSKKAKTKPDLVVGKKKYTTELIPPELVIARYFAKDQSAIEALEAQQAALEQQLEEMAEEHGCEGGLLEDAKNDKDKLTKASATARLKEITTDKDAADERQALQEYLGLVEQESVVSSSIKTANEALITKVAAKYDQLTDADIKTLVVDYKWISTLATAVQGELDRVSETLTDRIRQLVERYESPLPDILEELSVLSVKVDEHLKKMGAVWN
jgi:type I restriction enzyme M protein